jgi:hypothetical protein
VRIPANGAGRGPVEAGPLPENEAAAETPGRLHAEPLSRPPERAGDVSEVIERYIHWTRTDGAPFDPWLRTHWRLGASILAVVPLGMLVTGTISEWEQWTGMAFPESGQYVVPGALAPVHIDRERDLGRYEEPNVWMCHPVTPADA